MQYICIAIVRECFFALLTIGGLMGDPKIPKIPSTSILAASSQPLQGAFQRRIGQLPD